MIIEAEVSNLVEAFLQTEYPTHYIVDVSVHLGNRIVVELGCRAGIAIDDCVRITKYIESQFDREVEDFELEVGSAGLTSPFKVLRQYEDALDEEVELLRRGGVKERGILRLATADKVELEVLRKVKLEGAKRKTEVVERLTIPMDEVLQTKRVLKF